MCESTSFSAPSYRPNETLECPNNDTRYYKYLKIPILLLVERVSDI